MSFQQIKAQKLLSLGYLCHEDLGSSTCPFLSSPQNMLSKGEGLVYVTQTSLENADDLVLSNIWLVGFILGQFTRTSAIISTGVTRDTIIIIIHTNKCPFSTVTESSPAVVYKIIPVWIGMVLGECSIVALSHHLNWL